MGIPLIEITTAPDIKTPEQAKKILQDQLTELQELHQKIVGRLQAFMVQAQALDQQLQGMAK